jgi:hypothetical protein
MVFHGIDSVFDIKDQDKVELLVDLFDWWKMIVNPAVSEMHHF